MSQGESLEDACADVNMAPNTFRAYEPLAFGDEDIKALGTTWSKLWSKLELDKAIQNILRQS
jgi:hypothetical protein